MRHLSAHAPVWGAVVAAAILAGCSQPGSEPVPAPEPVFEFSGDMTIELLREPLPVSAVSMQTLDGRTRRLATGRARWRW